MKSKIDINTVIGFLLIGGILLFFGYFNSPDEESQKPADQEVVADSTQSEVTTADKSEPVSPDKDTATAAKISAAPDSTVNRDQYGPFAEAMQNADPGNILILENEKIKIEFAAKGAQVKSALLKGYQTYDSLPLHLIHENSSSFNLALTGGQRYYTADLIFNGQKLNDSTVLFTLTSNDGGELVYRYTLAQNGYMLDWDVYSKGLAGMLPGSETSMTWELKTLRHEKNLENERQMTAIEYRYSGDDDVDELNGSGLEEEKIEENIKWIAFKQQFFSSILLNKQGDFKSTSLVHKITEGEGEDYTKYLASNFDLSTGTDGNLDSDLGLYLGPNKFEILNSYNQEFEQLIPLGWGIFGWINRGLVINLFNWLDNYGLNYGLIILIIALLFKLILFPLTYQSYRSMAKMRVLKPEIDEINEKFKDKDQMKKQQATMELYQKAGVNPLGGCLPMLLQLPILIALFRFFPASIELRQESFLWATDLSTYDSVLDLPFNIPFYGDHVSLFTLLMTVSTLIYTYMNQQLTGSAQNQQFPQMKYIIYFMPIIFLGVFNNYAAGLSYYYFVANMITFGQQFAIKSFLDEDKIHAKIQEKKKKPKKENRLMRRMKDMQEQQNRQQRRKK